MGSAEPPLPAAVARAAVAQICSRAGYSAADAAALRALADLAARHLAATARAAVSLANSRSRTQPNLLDLAIAIELLSLPRGFPGAALPSSPLLSSSSGPLKGIIQFLASIDETPFAKSIMGSRKNPNFAEPSSSFAQLGLESPFPHVPRWLPRFPEAWQRPVGRRQRRRVELGWGAVEPASSSSSPPETARAAATRPLEARRARVKFRLCSKGGIGAASGERRAEKKVKPPLSSFGQVIVGACSESVPHREFLQLKFGLS
ncbi:transcription initiation factor TFIID subunit 8-like [Wolffia australiana]